MATSTNAMIEYDPDGHDTDTGVLSLRSSAISGQLWMVVSLAHQPICLIL